jgi:hypothetical protein
MDAITVKDQETYWMYLIKYQEAMIRLFKQMVDDLTWGCQENMTEAVFDDFAKPFKGNWKKFSRFYTPPKVEIANTDENVYDWTKPLRAL